MVVSRSAVFASLAVAALGLVLYWTAVPTLKPKSAPKTEQTEPKSNFEVRRAGDAWQIFAGGSSRSLAAVRIDGESMQLDAKGNSLEFVLSPGVHSIEIAGPVAKLLRIKEIGEQSSGAELGSAKRFVVSVPPSGALVPAQTIRAVQGDLVQIEVTSKAVATIHLHGYDIEGPVYPDRPLSLIFRANFAGRFGVEVHGSADHPPFAFVEVYPK